MQNSDGNKKNQHSVDPANEKRMHDHISNEKDEITEDDIKNVRTDLEGLAAHELSDDEKKVLKKKVEDDLDTSVDTTWNVLGT